MERRMALESACPGVKDDGSPLPYPTPLGTHRCLVQTLIWSFLWPQEYAQLTDGHGWVCPGMMPLTAAPNKDEWGWWIIPLPPASSSLKHVPHSLPMVPSRTEPQLPTEAPYALMHSVGFLPCFTSPFPSSAAWDHLPDELLALRY